MLKKAKYGGEGEEGESAMQTWHHVVQILISHTASKLSRLEHGLSKVGAALTFQGPE